MQEPASSAPVQPPTLTFSSVIEAIPWRVVAGALAIGALWTGYWLCVWWEEHGEKPSVPPVVLSEELARLCDQLERRGPGVAGSVTSRLKGRSPGERRLVLERALTHALQNPTASPYIPVLFAERGEVFPLIRERAREEARVVELLGLFGNLYLEQGRGRWAPEVTSEQRQFLYDCLVRGLEHPSAEPARTVRETALGLVSFLNEPEALPALKRLAREGFYAGTRQAAATLVRRYEARTHSSN